MYFDYSASFISYHSTSGSKIKDKEGKPKLHTLAAKALDMYRQRWQIKTMFKGLESSGFNNEDSHVRIQKRMANFFAIVIIAYVWCCLVGIYIHENIKEIRVLHHVMKKESFQILIRVHLTMPSEPYEPLSNRYFQIFVIYLVFG